MAKSQGHKREVCAISGGLNYFGVLRNKKDFCTKTGVFMVINERFAPLYMKE